MSSTDPATNPQRPLRRRRAALILALAVSGTALMGLHAAGASPSGDTSTTTTTAPTPLEPTVAVTIPPADDEVGAAPTIPAGGEVPDVEVEAAPLEDPNVAVTIPPDDVVVCSVDETEEGDAGPSDGTDHVSACEAMPIPVPLDPAGICESLRTLVRPSDDPAWDGWEDNAEAMHDELEEVLGQELPTLDEADCGDLQPLTSEELEVAVSENPPTVFSNGGED